MDALPLKARLLEALRCHGASCPLCDLEEETAVHLFGFCPFARALWFSSPWATRFSFNELDFGSSLVNLFPKPPDPIRLAGLSEVFYCSLPCWLISFGKHATKLSSKVSEPTHF